MTRTLQSGLLRASQAGLVRVLQGQPVVSEDHSTTGLLTARTQASALVSTSGAAFTDDFNRTSPAGPAGSTAGSPVYALGSNYRSWDASNLTNGVVIHNNTLTQYAHDSFYSVVLFNQATATDNQFVEFDINFLDTQIWVLLRVHDDLFNATTGPDADATTPNGCVTSRIQMGAGTPGRVTTLINGTYQGPANITGSTRYDDGLSHRVRMEITGGTGGSTLFYVDGALKLTGSGWGTALPTGSVARHGGIQFAGDGVQQYIDNLEWGDL